MSKATTAHGLVRRDGKGREEKRSVKGNAKGEEDGIHRYIADRGS